MTEEADGLTARTTKGSASPTAGAGRSLMRPSPSMRQTRRTKGASRGLLLQRRPRSPLLRGRLSTDLPTA